MKADKGRHKAQEPGHGSPECRQFLKKKFEPQINTVWEMSLYWLCSRASTRASPAGILVADAAFRLEKIIASHTLSPVPRVLCVFLARCVLLDIGCILDMASCAPVVSEANFEPGLLVPSLLNPLCWRKAWPRNPSA